MRDVPRPPARRSVALAVILMCQLMVVVDVNVVNIALVPIQRTLHFSTANLAWVVDAYTVTFGGLLLLGGRAGDVFGRRRMLIAGLTLFTLASLTGGLATSATMLLVARAIQGVGAAMASPSTLSLISAIFAEGPERNRALGTFTAVSAGGGSFGLVAGGALVSWVSWRWVLFINVPIGVAAIALAPRFVPEPPRNGGKLDLPGAVLVTLGISAVTYGFIRLAQHGTLGPTLGTFLSGAVLLTAFVLVEQRRARPLFPLRLLAHRPRAAAYAVFLLVPSLMFGVFFFTSQYMEKDLHFSAIRTGLGFLPLTMLIFAFSRVGPRLVARFGARPIILFGLTLLVIAALWISRATAGEGYLRGLAGPLVLFGLGVSSCFLPVSITILGGVPREDAGAASGMLQTMQQTGASLGIASLTSVAVTYGRSGAMVAGAGIAGVALLISLCFITPTRTGSPGALPPELELDAEAVAVFE